MTEGDFSTIEQALGLELPASYRRFMRAYPFQNGPPSDAYLPDNALFICNLNRQILADKVYPKSWRPSFLAIGTTSCGSAYVLDTALEISPVYKIDQEEDVLAIMATSLDPWVDQLVQWYVRFDPNAVLIVYRALTAVICDAGFFIRPPEPMDGWHRVVVSLRADSGNSFWVSIIREQWFVGTWAGHLYRIGDCVSDFCVEWLTEEPVGTCTDFSPRIKAKYNLSLIEDFEFENWVRGR